MRRWAVRYWSRWKYTTLLAGLMLTLIVFGIVPHYRAREACEDRGGVYVNTGGRYGPYTCLSGERR